MFRKAFTAAFAASALLFGSLAGAEPSFINGLVLPGSLLDKTGAPGANQGRVGYFSDLYFDPKRRQWWALSDRGPGGGVIDYQTRLQRFDLRIDPRSGAISHFRITKTIRFTDPDGLLHAGASSASTALNGLNPGILNGNAAVLGRSFDPEGLVISPISGHFIVSDEYGPSVYEFNRRGELVKVFQTPDNLKPRLTSGALDYVQGRGTNGVFFGRQDNRGFEGLAITPDGKRIYAVLQDPLINEPGPNNGRDGRNVRIVAFDSDPRSARYGQSLAQYVYQLEPQADIAARINAQKPGNATATDPRQGRNIGLSAIVALNANEFLVLERDNRGIGVDDPAGANAVGSKRVYKIDVRNATDVTGVALGADALPTGVVAVSKSAVFIDLTANSVLPNAKQTEKWEGLTIGPRLRDGSYVIVAGNDNDYSVTQDGTTNAQFDVYVDFNGNSVQRDLDQPTRLNGADVGAPPAGYTLIPAVLHAYRASAADLAGYVRPGAPRGHRDDDDDDHAHGHDGDRDGYDRDDD